MSPLKVLCSAPMLIMIVSTVIVCAFALAVCLPLIAVTVLLVDLCGIDLNLDTSEYEARDVPSIF